MKPPGLGRAAGGGGRRGGRGKKGKAAEGRLEKRQRQKKTTGWNVQVDLARQTTASQIIRHRLYLCFIRFIVDLFIAKMSTPSIFPTISGIRSRTIPRIPSRTNRYALLHSAQRSVRQRTPHHLATCSCAPTLQLMY